MAAHELKYASHFVGPKIGVVGSILSPFVRKVLALCHAKGIAYELDSVVPFFFNDEMQKLSPLSRAPVVFHEGVVMADSTVVCEYLEERFADRTLMYPPRDQLFQRARARWVEEFADTRLADVILWKIWTEYSLRPFIFGQKRNQSVIDEAFEVDLPPILRYMENELLAEVALNVVAPSATTTTTTSSLTTSSGGLPENAFLFGSRPLLADFALAGHFRMLELLKKFPAAPVFAPFPKVISYVNRVLQSPEVHSMRAWENAVVSQKPTEHNAVLRSVGAPISDVLCFGGTRPKL